VHGEAGPSRLRRFGRGPAGKSCYPKIKFLSLDMIEELLEKREDLFEIAALLYGDSFVSCQDFWGSPTERHLNEVYEQLYNLGYEFPKPSEEQIDAAMILAKKLGLGLPPEE
jgi:hypothetical protein